MKTMRIAAAIAVASGLAFLATPGAQAQQKDSLTIGLTLEPPHLDPTAGAAAAR